MKKKHTMSKKYEKLVTNFDIVKACTVDVELICKKWEKHWTLSQWHNEYRFIIPDRRSRDSCIIKILISVKQAEEIINKISLQKIPSGIFKNAHTWVI